MSLVSLSIGFVANDYIKLMPCLKWRRSKYIW